jgi:UDP-glucose 4-epimerase
LPIAEDSPADPECSYGISKLAIEKYLFLFKHLHGLDYTIVRPSNPYGSRQNPAGIQGAISVFLGKVARNEAIEIWGDGDVVRDYIYIDDLVEGMYRAATMTAPARIYNLGSGTGHSLNQIVKVIRDVTLREVQVVHTPKRAFDIPRIYLDVSRAGRELDWAPQTTLEAGVGKVWEFIMHLQRTGDCHDRT